MQPRITLISNATTRALRSATFGGDDSLDDVGRAKAARLARHLESADRCWTSPAARAKETAEALGLKASEEPRLRDGEYGRWTGLRFQQVLLKEPRKLVSWVRNPEGAPHGGETLSQIIARVSAWMDEMGRLKGHTVAVTHSAIIRAAIVHVIQAEPRSFWRIDVVPLAFADFRTNGRRWVLRALAAPADEAD